MCKSIMRKLVIVFFVLGFSALSSSAFAQGQWENAYNEGQESTGDMMLTKCIYKTIGGFSFSIIVRGMCPYSVNVNPETGQVQRQGY